MWGGIWPVQGEGEDEQREGWQEESRHFGPNAVEFVEEACRVCVDDGCSCDRFVEEVKG